MPIKINGWDLKPTTFPGGELLVRVASSNSEVAQIDARIHTSEDIVALMMAVDALRRSGYKYLELYMPYIPYARQDRVCNAGEAHSLRVFADLINGMRFEEVHVLDPHSDVCEALFDRLVITKNTGLVTEVLHRTHIATDMRYAYVAAPDAGATKKTHALLERLALYHLGFVQCNKKRDLATGKLAGFEAYTNTFDGDPVLVVDDICDGGGTFLGLADALKAKHAGDLHLVVSHGIFSQGFDALLEKYTSITYTDSYKKHDIKDPRVRCLQALL